MKKLLECRLLHAVALLVSLFALSGLATAGTQYVVTNDDAAFPFLTGVSFYSINANGLPVFQQQVQTGQFGIGGGYFGMKRIAVLNAADQQCVYVSEAANRDVVGINVNTLTVGGITTGSNTDGGSSNGIGLAINTNYLYASFSDSNTIGTFQVQSGCSLAFLGDTSVVGIHHGVINGMAVHGTMLIASYTDGSIESFDVSGGTPVSNGDKQNATATVRSQDATYPNSIDITSDGHYAIFGDTSTEMSLEVSDISSGKLTKTKVYQTVAAISSSNIILSPDETMLYVVNTQSARVSALFFDKKTGKISGGCRSGPLAGLSQNYSYLAGVALMSQTGNGGGVYVAEFGGASGIATVPLSLTGQKCSLQEASGSPAADLNSPGLLSIDTFPPRSF
jgi:6-phosphogluconolactonase (cycloisomerase 2 family)